MELKKSKIYVVPTPIGNLADITLRSLDVLKNVDVIYCEDTRNTSKLLNYYDIKTPLVSYHKHNEQSRSEEIIDKILLENINCAVVSDAGMPSISDPGQILLEKAIDRDVDIEVLPGASAAITALVRSGFDSLQFAFLGFVPRKNADKNKFYDQIKNATMTTIIYESVHRVEATVQELSEFLGDRKICVLRELTKIHESVMKGTCAEVIEMLKNEIVKGEFVIVIDKLIEEDEDIDVKEKLTELINDGMSKKQAVKIVSDVYGLKKNDVYKESLEL
ncbi:MAG: 16S rRNA (cytidine(1402)-2'-O)-methyltransferase [Finegoldia magna]|uniref:16S rRNA (cytidine(1402)-2'-O)-methyltransferase n=1 Tax=Finegoldia magna TaxID=1260 RepID=UPI00280555F5|nr:16S rRNA (cytidine(1402)-2'-O)-methyltransferase [Finegoldia magna]MDU1398802.1 16S rRNA (cytidine(1402)-2'-O)-methyltransferase [Finegoldia magna]MDU2897385.1 16S rRNA (cytidine(1402)-2'-O)-methyltransferase [Finegoldia magna]MDU5369229.1 16S rRNA (cytidine(1402)-2'-O)-methyltransferase [Finegoldia magna]MDU5443781.1 16S rRNA (cytidine(1402)-2'-O)-methyltransferase [Finegoldia magna]MDU7385289.1 16S rRNA (cytidine(1402)-2'-O)-methyltransferase [Finegoldia magna]